MAQILLFAGTSEGRQLAEHLSACGVSLLSVWQPRMELLLNHAHASVLQGRMDREEMVSFLRMHPVDCVVDATHPYAVLATENILAACQETGTDYFRLLREEATPKWQGGLLLCCNRTRGGRGARGITGECFTDYGVKRAFCVCECSALSRPAVCADASNRGGNLQGKFARFCAGAFDLHAGTVFRGTEPCFVSPISDSDLGDKGIW